MLKTARPVDTETLDRLEEKVKLLVALIGRMRTEQARLADEYEKVSKSLDTTRARLLEVEGATVEMPLPGEATAQVLTTPAPRETPRPRETTFRPPASPDAHGEEAVPNTASGLGTIERYDANDQK